jgi:hypothetical protein
MLIGEKVTRENEPAKRGRSMAYLALAILVMACGEGTTIPVSPSRLVTPEGVVEPSAAISPISLAVGDSVRFNSVLAGSRKIRRSTGGTPLQYRSSNAAVASISSTGMVRGIANGTTYVLAQLGLDRDSVLIVVGSGASLSVSPATASLNVGSSLSLTVVGGDQSTAFIAADTTVARVSAAGIVTAVAAGNTTVRARTASGAEATSVISVPMMFSPQSISVNVGSSVQLTTGPRSQGCSQQPLFNSANSSIVTVSQSGVVTGVTSGSTSIQVSAGACNGTVSVISTAAAPVPPGGGAVAVNLVRFKGSAGAVNFANGIPLPPGKLRASELGNVRLFLSGVEQPLFVRALGGKYPDGSLRAVLIQGTVVAPDSGLSVAGTLSFNSPRVAGTLPAATMPATLAAAVLPSSADYLVSTLVAGQQLTESQVATQPLAIRDHVFDFETMAPRIDAAFPQYARGIAVYEHVLTHYQHFIQTADPRWFAVAWQQGETYRAYIDANDAPEWNMATEGMAVHYWFSGDERSRVALGKMVRWLTSATQYVYTWPDPDAAYRLKGRSLEGALDCIKVECDPGTDPTTGGLNIPYDIRAILPTIIPKLMTVQSANGLFPGRNIGGGQKNYQIGNLLTGLLRYYDEFQADPVVLQSIKKSLDYMWANEWSEERQGFRYCTYAAGDCGSGGPEPGLNNLILPAYAWYYYKTRDPAYKDMADRIFLGTRATRTQWPSYPMQFDQAMYRCANYYAWRQ